MRRSSTSPESGRRVTHYTLELPVNREQTQAFLIPDDCDAVMQAINEGATRWGSIVDRRFWKKVEGDCRHHRILHRLPQRVIEDHVSGYDFMNARLSDLPIDPRCTSPGPGGLQPLATDAFGMLLYFPLTQQVTAPPAGVECTQCEFKDGLLRGRIFSDEDGISCEAVPYGPSLRLIAVDFADINGDGFLDAVLRFIPVGPGSMQGAPDPAADQVRRFRPIYRAGNDAPYAAGQSLRSTQTDRCDDRLSRVSVRPTVLCHLSGRPYA